MEFGGSLHVTSKQYIPTSMRFVQRKASSDGGNKDRFNPRYHCFEVVGALLIFVLWKQIKTSYTIYVLWLDAFWYSVLCNWYRETAWMQKLLISRAIHPRLTNTNFATPLLHNLIASYTKSGNYAMNSRIEFEYWFWELYLSLVAELPLQIETLQHNVKVIYWQLFRKRIK